MSGASLQAFLTESGNFLLPNNNEENSKIYRFNTEEDKNDNEIDF